MGGIGIFFLYDKMPQQLQTFAPTDQEQVFVPISPAQSPQNFLNNLSIKNTSKEWLVTKQTGEEGDLIFWTLDAKDKKTELGWIPPDNNCAGWVDKNLWYQNGTEILDDKDKAITLKCESSKCGGQNCYHISLTNAQAENIDEFIQLGNNSVVTEYQDVNILNYKSDWFDVNISLECQDTPQNEIWVRHDSNKDKFGANGTFEDVRECLYNVKSDNVIISNNNKPYLRKIKHQDRSRIQESHIFDFTDICTKTNISGEGIDSDCVYEYYNTEDNCTVDEENLTTCFYTYYLNVTFNSNSSIDPSISVDEFKTSESIDTNVTQENNFTHLDISDVAPYDSLVAYYPFDVNNDSNGLTYDYTDNDNEGTLASDGGVIWNSTGLFGGAYEYDGIDDNNEQIGADVQLVSDYPFTISGWIKKTDISSGVILSLADKSETNVHYYISVGTDGLPIALVRDAGIEQAKGTTNISDDLNTWYHIVGVFVSDTNRSVWVNGVIEGSDTENVNYNTGIDRWSIGRVGDSTPGGYLNGTIDEVMIFNTSLTAQQISDIYNNQSSRFRVNGTQELKQFNITSGNNTVNVSTTSFQELFGSDLLLRLGEWDVERGYNDSLSTNSEDFNYGLVGYWHFDNLSSEGENDTLVKDFSGNGNNGTAKGDAGWVSDGVFAGSYEFDGDGDYVNISNNINISQITLSVWFNPNEDFDTNSRDNNIIAKRPGGTAIWQLFARSDVDDIRFRVDTSGGSTVLDTDNSGNWNANQWYHLIATFNTTDLIMYLNGVENAFVQHSNPGVIKDLSGFTLIGNFETDNNYFNGTIDEVMIFNRSLSADEITELYVKGRALFNYSDYEDVDTVNNTFSINTSSTNFILDYKFNAGNSTNPFYSPILESGINLDFYTLEEAGADNPPTVTLIFPVDNNVTNQSVVHFNCSATDDNNLTNVTLYVWNWSSSEQVYTNFTNLTGTSNSTDNLTLDFSYDGNFSWNCLFTDNSSNTAWASANFSLNISTTVATPPDSTPPYFDEAVTNQSYDYDSNFGYNINASDETTFGYFAVDNSNFTINDSGYLTNSTTLSVGIQSINVSINDSSNNVNSTIMNVSVNQIVPQGSISGTASITFGTAGDVQGIETNVNGDGDVTYELFRNQTLNTDWISVSNPDTSTLGVDTYYYIYNTTGGINYTSNASIDTFSLEVTAIAPTLNLTLNNSQQNISIVNGTEIDVNCSTVTGDSSATLSLYNNGTLINQGTSPINNFTNFTGHGGVNVTCIYTASQNYTTQSQLFYVNLTEPVVGDTTDPVVTIRQPSTNLTETTDTQYDVNYTATDETAIDSCWWSENRGTTNNSLADCETNITGETWTEGSNTIFVYANDSSNNLGFDTVTFTLDTTAPTFDNLANQSIYDNQSLSYDIDATESGVGIETWAINWSDTFSIDSSGIVTNTSGLSIGVYWINVSVNDTLGNMVSGLFFVNVSNSSIEDTTPPTFDNFRNVTHTTNTSLSESFSASDGTGIGTYALNDTSYFNITQAGLITNITNLSRIEIHWLNVSVNDTSGNMVSGVFFINVTAAAVAGPTTCGSIQNTVIEKGTTVSPYVQLCYSITFQVISALINSINSIKPYQLIT